MLACRKGVALPTQFLCTFCSTVVDTKDPKEAGDSEGQTTPVASESSATTEAATEYLAWAHGLCWRSES